MSLATWSRMVSMLDVFYEQNYQICMPFAAILKYDPSYKILQCYVSLYNHIILVEKLNREGNKVSCEILLMKID